MLSFNQGLKDEIVAEIIRHREQDQIIQGVYWDEKEQKGCAVGCAIHSLNLRKGKNLSTARHSVYESEFGIPIILAKLEDRIFEGLSVEDSKTWPENFMSAIPVDTDLSLVWAKFAIWLLNDVKQYSKKPEVVQKVSDLYLESVEGRLVTIEQWRKSKVAAYAAYAADAADAAAYAAYAAAAYAAYAADAADAAAYTADAAYRHDYYKKMADKLIEILKETK